MVLAHHLGDAPGIALEVSGRRHSIGPTKQPRPDRVVEGLDLCDGQADAFPGDRVKVAGRVTNQRYSIGHGCPRDLMQRPDGSGGGGRLGPSSDTRNRGKRESIDWISPGPPRTAAPSGTHRKATPTSSRPHDVTYASTPRPQWTSTYSDRGLQRKYCYVANRLLRRDVPCSPARPKQIPTARSAADHENVDCSGAHVRTRLPWISRRRCPKSRS